MNESELIRSVQASVYRQCQSRGYAAPVDVLMDMGVLDKKKYEGWRYGRVPYLEAVCVCNLRQLALILKQIHVYAEKAGYKPSFCCYRRWGAKKKSGQGYKTVNDLRFSKSGKRELEKAYAMHWVDMEMMKKMKMQGGRL